jgi:hypothetical protein
MGAPSGTAAGAFGVLAGAVTEISKTAVESAKQGAAAQVEAANLRADAAVESSRPDVQFEAHNRSIEMVTDAAKGAIELVKENSPRQADPIEMMKAAGDIYEKATRAHLSGSDGTETGAGTLGVFVQIMKEKDTAQAALAREQWGFMKEMFEMQRTAHVAPAVAAAAAPTNPIDIFEDTFVRMERWSGIMDRLGGRGRRRDADYEPPPAAPVAPPSKPISQLLFENLPAVLTITALAANILYNMRSKPGDAVSPGEAIQKMNEQAGALGLGGAAAAPAAAAPAAAAPAAAAAVQTDPNDPLAAWRAFIDQIAESFVLHFFTEGFDSLSFTEHLLSDGAGGPEKPSGRRKYEIMRSTLGEANFKRLARENAEIWSKVGGQPQAFDQFVSDIFNFDQLVKEQESREPVGVTS